MKTCPGNVPPWDDAVTLFHEFGHALHGLMSSVEYPSLSGTAVPRDYVEFPSQLLEHWLSTDEVLQRFALHYRTGEPIPQDLVRRIERASKFNQGFATTEYLASALIDMKLHLAGGAEIDPKAFERAEQLARMGVSQSQARELYGNAANRLPGLDATTRRFNLGGTGIGDFEQAVVGQDATQVQRFGRAMQREQSSFSSTTDTRRDNTGGLTGLRQR